MANTFFEKFDANKNGKIEYKDKEFKHTFVDKKNEKDDEDDLFGTDYYRVESIDYKELFKKADANNDGTVNKQELTTYIKKYDKNNDGSLEHKVFGAFWNSKSEGNIFEKENQPKSTTLSNWSSFKPSAQELEAFRQRKD